ncbi:MAG: 3-deoxy-8-phosphooctulonate synthase [Elusimicrobia bacterium RIFOXYA2_FULL_50_26]|nr:MAG: 3-deoxy-8-phosphooctulonate synthase [Elusimicrobia bacterium RIFOXYA2_FULL_50_26]OGS24011.1 MAG: 3-deoxy-8-phosphooctulonate synthase [Elusimicrobia bacterium RIFOXYB2_FULL_50_12]
MKYREIRLRATPLTLSNNKPIVLIAGPCVIESEITTLNIASRLKTIANRLNIKLIFKASYDKANRSSIGSYRGPGIEQGLRILARVKAKYGLPVITDVHTPQEAARAAEVADILQLPAFLCRQTDLIVACARTGLPVNVKKGQFVAPDDVIHIVKKAESTGNKNIMLTERGSSFGYHNLVVDMRSIPIMKETSCPVVFDATHSVQLPGGKGSSSGGQRQFVEPLSKAAVSIGIAALFLEVHPDPRKALSDGANSLSLDELPALLKKIIALDRLVK